jgi:hypothetical protein
MSRARTPPVPRCDLVTVQDLGHAIDLVAYDGGAEIARVTLAPLAALSVAMDLIGAARRHLQRAKP